MAKSYRDLIIWQKAMDLVIATYELTEQFPTHERYGLVSQMRRAAIAIPSNIAEGYQRHSSREYLQFLSIAFASGAELETHIEICKRLPSLKHLSFTRIEMILGEVMRLLNVSIQKQRAR
jgi:four helix bundle protein